MKHSINLVSGTVSDYNIHEFKLLTSSFNHYTIENFNATEKNVFYIDYHPELDIGASLNYFNAILHLIKPEDKFLIVTEGFDNMFGHPPEIYEHHVDISNVVYWKIVQALKDKGIDESQLHVISHNDGYQDQIDELASRKIRWTNSTYEVRAKFLCLNPYLFLYTKELTETKSRHPKYLFASLANGRPSKHRYDFTSKLFENKLHGLGKISMCRMTGPDEKLNAILPIIYDDKHNLWTTGQLENSLFEDVLIWISNETYLDQKGIRGYSEKTIKAIYHKTPFIINGDDKILKHLHKDGFKTFDEFWDESYDEMSNINNRQDAIIDILKNLQHKDRTTLYEKMKTITEYNYRHLMQTDWSKKLQNFLS